MRFRMSRRQSCLAVEFACCSIRLSAALTWPMQCLRMLRRLQEHAVAGRGVRHCMFLTRVGCKVTTAGKDPEHN